MLCDKVSISERYFSWQVKRDGMVYKELAYEIMQTLRQRRHPIDDIRELEKGESGILQALLINEKNGGESLSPGELSAIQELSTGRVAIALNSLENKNHIERQMDKEDRRRIIVTLTKAGRQCAEQLLEQTIANFEEVLRKIGEQDANDFFRIIKRLIDVYEA